MPHADRKIPDPDPNPKVAEELAKYGITRTSVDFYDYGGFRFTNLEDAVAQAKRRPKPV